MVVNVADNPPRCDTAYDQQSNQRMGKLNIADPQQPDQNYDIGKGVAQVILTDDDQERQQGKQPQRNYILPEHQLVFVLAHQYSCQE
ncbi:hypothetical protein D3C73_1290590 [compost metagenome]